jgi:heme A synthase
LALLDPTVAGTAVDLLRDARAGQPLQWLHRLAGLLLLIALVVAAGSALLRAQLPKPRRLAWTGGAAAATGLVILAADAPLLAAVAHATLAGLALAACAGALARLGIASGRSRR